MSANILLSILPGGPAPQGGGAATPSAGGDASAFLALLGGAIDAAEPQVFAQLPVKPAEVAAPANAALALQVVPEIAAEIAHPTMTDEAAPLIPEGEDAIAAAPVAEALVAERKSSQAEAKAPPQTDAPQTDDQAVPVVAQIKSEVATEAANTAPETAADAAPENTASKAASQAQLENAPDPPAPPPQPIIVAAVQAPPTQRASTAPSAERKIDPDGKSAPQLEAGAPIAPEQADAAPEAPSEPKVQPDARDAKAAPQAKADAAPAPAQAQAANNAAPMPSTTPEVAAAARPADVSSTRADSAQAARSANLAPAAAAVAQQIVRRFDGGTTRFEIRLDPAELGRVDVRLEVSRDKKVTATIAADNPQTLQDLSRASRELQRALADAGLEMADNGLTFSDRREQSAWERTGNEGDLRGRQYGGDAEDAAPVEQRRLGIDRWGGARVDVWV